LSEVAGKIWIVGSPKRADPERVIGCEWLTDPVAYEGPLAGLETGLAAVAPEAADRDWVMVVPCDHPGLAVSFLKRLIDHEEANADAVIIESEGIWNPFPGLYRVGLGEQAKSLSPEQGRGLKHLLQKVKTKVVSADLFRDIDPELLNLRSVDTPGEWENFQRGE
jgi:molybdopterin-guanine dinucleotide biosynthesis protein A